MSANGKRKPDDLLVALLAAGKTARDAAPLCGCSERHVSRRLADPDFVAKVNAARSQLAADCTGRLAALLTEAVETLGRCSAPRWTRFAWGPPGRSWIASGK